MEELQKKYLQDITAEEILKNVYPDTLEKIVIDIQGSIDDSQSWLESPKLPGNNNDKLSDKEIYELNKDIILKTKYVKSLLELYADYNYLSTTMQDLCSFYGIKTFKDKFSK